MPETACPDAFIFGAECPIAFDVQAETVTDVEATITWSMVDTVVATNARYKPVNETEWDTLENISSPLNSLT
jgi:hypothetical protein